VTGASTFNSAVTFGSTASVAGNLSFNSGYGSSAVAYGCRAWVNFNGTGTVAIRASGNVTSITDNGTGSYTVNFTTAMPDTNYSVAKSDNFYSLGDVKTFNTTNVTVQCYQAIGSAVDTSIVCVSIFR
jgi:hypothetical protein